MSRFGRRNRNDNGNGHSGNGNGESSGTGGREDESNIQAAATRLAGYAGPKEQHALTQHGTDHDNTIPLGPNPKTGKLVSVNIAPDFELPVHVQGPTGYGKTLLQVYLFVQTVLKLGIAGIFSDFSEDQAALNYMLEKFREAGRKVYFVSPVPEHDSAWFDPFASLPELTVLTAVLYKDFFMAALSLGHTGQHQFWGKINDVALLRTFINLALAGITRPSWEDITRELDRVAKRLRKNDTIEAQIEIEQLTTQRILKPGDPAKRIDYDEVWEEGHVVLLALSALLNSASPAIGALHIWAAVAAAMRRRRRGRPRKRLALNIDEWAMVGHVSGYQLLLVLCRKLGIAPLLLANQSSAQLKDAGTDTLVFDNTPTKILLAPLADDIDTIKSLSRETWKTSELPSQTVSGFNVSQSTNSFKEATLETNDVLSVALTPMQGYYISLRHGLVEPQPFIFEPPWTVEDWQRWELTPLPMREDVEQAEGPPEAAPKAVSKATKKKREKLAKDFGAKVAALYRSRCETLGLNFDGDTE